MIRKFAPPAALALTTLATLGGCAGGGDFPSLARRDVERAHTRYAAPPATDTPTPEPTLSADTLTRLRQLEGQVRDAHAAFEAKLPEARRRIARGQSAARNSDAWLDGQVARADLGALRSRTAVPLADLDQLDAEQTIAGTPDAAIAQTLAMAKDLIAQEDAALAQLAF